MKNPANVITRWSIFVLFIALLASLSSVWLWLLIKRPDIDVLPTAFVVLLFILSALLWPGAILAITRRNLSLAVTLIVISGVISLPGGVLLFVAGARIRSAMRTIAQSNPDKTDSSVEIQGNPLSVFWYCLCVFWLALVVWSVSLESLPYLVPYESLRPISRLGFLISGIASTVRTKPMIFCSFFLQWILILGGGLYVLAKENQRRPILRWSFFVLVIAYIIGWIWLNTRLL